MPKKNIASLMREHTTLILIIAVVLFLLELEIFALAAMKSGRKSRLQLEYDGKEKPDQPKVHWDKVGDNG